MGPAQGECSAGGEGDRHKVIHPNELLGYTEGLGGLAALELLTNERVRHPGI